MITFEYLTTKEAFLKMKEEQKAIAHERKTKEASYAYWKAHGEWRAKEPKSKGAIGRIVSNDDQARKDWQKLEPQRPEILTAHETSYARSFNIAYGFARGKTYSQVEKHVRKDTPTPDWYRIGQICSSFGFDITEEMQG